MELTLDKQLEVRALAGSIGAEIRGVDLKQPIGDNLRGVLRAALLENMVLFFPDQFLGDAELKAFGKTWGDLAVYDVAPTTDGDPDIVELKASGGRIADVWHTDQTFQPDPPMGSILNMVKSPDRGGDTMWSSQYEAYDNLSEPMRNLLDGLTAMHELPFNLQRSLKNPNAAPVSGTEHPVVRVHPETNRRYLYVNRMYTSRILQLAPAESDALLAFLFTHSEDARFMVRYTWSEGTIAIWDNRCTQHCVVSDFDGERIIRRVTIAGETAEKPTSKWDTYRPRRLTSRVKLAG